MAKDHDRPTLRLVAPDDRTQDEEPVEPEVSASAETPATSASAPVIDFNAPHVPTDEAVAFLRAAEDVDGRVIICAGYLASVGLYLLDSALSLYAEAMVRAAPGTFRHNAPPGLQSANATRVWIDGHLTSVKRTLETDATHYEKAADLKKAVIVAGEELDRALDAAKKAGLWTKEQCPVTFNKASESLVVIGAFVKQRSEAQAARLAPKTTLMERYLFGANALVARA